MWREQQWLLKMRGSTELTKLNESIMKTFVDGWPMLQRLITYYLLNVCVSLIYKSIVTGTHGLNTIKLYARNQFDFGKWKIAYSVSVRPNWQQEEILY